MNEDRDAAAPSADEPASRGSRGGVLRAIVELSKVRITVIVTLSVLTGYLLFAQQLNAGALLPMLGVFLLACGSAALNHVQEAPLDARMKRTQRRPIPSGRIPRDWALFVSLALMGAGFTALASVERHTFIVLGLGALSVVWYNGVYVFLKRVTPFAVVPGALIGAIPPVIGWVSAGGLWNDAQILDVAFFFLLWQIPHFWLLLLLFGADYERAGFPTLQRHFRPRQLGGITFAWVLALAATGLALAPALGYRVPWNLMLLVVSIWLVTSSVGIIRGADDRKKVFAAFMRINFYLLAVMLILTAESLLP